MLPASPGPASLPEAAGSTPPPGVTERLAPKSTGTPILIGLFVVIGGLLAWNALAALSIMRLGLSPLPFHDQWAGCVLPDLCIRDFFAQHNEHRPALYRIVELLDWRFDDARNGLNLSFIALCFPAFGLALFGLLATIIPDWRKAALTATLSSAIVVSTAQHENLLWGFQTAFVGSFVATFLALFFAVWVSRPGQSAAWRAMAAALCMVASFAAAFSLASGVLALGFVTILLFAARARASLKIAYIGFAAATLWLYFHGYNPDRATSFEALGAYVRFGLAYIGSPFAAGNLIVAEAIGALGLSLLTALIADAILLCFTRLELPPPPKVTAYTALLLFAVFIVCTAALTSLGRTHFGVEQGMASRYATPALLLWAVLCAVCIARGNVISAQGSSFMQLGGGALGMVLASYVAFHQLDYAAAARMIPVNRLNGAIAYLLGIRNQPAVLQLYGVAAAVANGYLDQQFFGLLHARKSAFADDWAGRLGTPLRNWKQPQSECRGFIDTHNAVPDQKTPMFTFTGWAWDDRRKAVPDLIVFSDNDGIVVGFAAPGYERDDVRRGERGIPTDYAGWQGYVKSDARTTSIHASGIFFERSSQSCEFARLSPDETRH